MVFSDLEKFRAALIEQNGRIIAFDLGTKRIGIAICDDSRQIATPKGIFLRLGKKQDFQKLSSLILESKVVALVIGMPTNLDGSKTAMTDFVLRFTKNFVEFWQKNQLPFLPIMLWDERLSSFEARNKLSEVKNNKRKFYDDIAANIILEHFLHDLQNSEN